MSNNDDKILQALENIQADITALRAGQHTLEAGQKALESGLHTLDLKVEAIHTYQKKAHDEIMGHVIDINEIGDRDHKVLEKRVERIEKHLDLPPVK
jgi:chromosome segregation ATPase